MKMKYILAGIIFLFLIPIGLSLDITSCKSGSTNWLCDRGHLCACEISGTCNNGNVLLYENDISNILCAPQIANNKANIDWSLCNTTLDSVRIIADCNEGQSLERMIILSGATTSTITSTSGTTSAGTTAGSTTTQTTIEYTGMCGSDGYCEKTENECLTDYTECSENDNECNTGEKCCCPPSGTTTTTKGDKSGFNFLWIIPVIIVVIAVAIYFIFIRGRERQTILSFRKLYEKWSR